MNKFGFAALSLIGAVVAWRAPEAKIDVAEAFYNMQEQIRGVAKERVTAMDLDEDGFVTKSEYDKSEFARINLQNKLKFSDFDVNNDGKFNEEDYFTTLSIRNYQLLVRIAKTEEAKESQNAKDAEKADKTNSKDKKK